MPLAGLRWILHVSINFDWRRKIMFGLGLAEAAILLVIVLLLFGGKKLPQLGSALGKTLTNFKKGLKEEDIDDKDDQNKSS